MSRVAVRDHVIWINHITGNAPLSARLTALPAGTLVMLSVNGVSGSWQKMADKPNGSPTQGLKPTGAAKAAWGGLYRTAKCSTVPIQAAQAGGPGPAAAQARPTPPQTALPASAAQANAVAPIASPPKLVVHADWSTDASKRWQATARLQTAGYYRVERPELVGNLSDWFDRLRRQAGGGAAVFVGFDFPIGVPKSWADQVAVTRFLDLLPQLGQGQHWGNFFTIAEQANQIGLRRPFYPRSSNHPKGTVTKAQLVAALSVSNFDALRRRCEEPSANRTRAASPLFWLVGAQQVGRAAITGWRDLFQPELARGSVPRFWPFEGSLSSLLGQPGVVLAETYPGEMYGHLNLRVKKKTDQADRRLQAHALLKWADEADVELSLPLRRALRDGFGSDSSGEDRFDAAVGAFGMLNVVLGRRAAGQHPDSFAAQVEGWILGQ